MGLKVVNEEQKAIIEYIKDHFVGWLEEKNIIPFPQRANPVETQLLERMVRVEEEIKRQNEKFERIDERFEHMNEKFDMMIAHSDKRFEAIDQRFEAIDQRFEQIDRRFNRMYLFQLATFTAIVGSAVAVILKA